MKKNSFILLTRIFLVLILLSPLSNVYAKAPARQFYQLTVYHFASDSQETVIDNYLKNALIPALHRMKLEKIGVFKVWGNDTLKDKRLYVLIPIQSLDMVTKIQTKLLADKTYQTDGAEYINAVHTTPPYTRMENILLEAFSLAPKLQMPAVKARKQDRVYELRSYESASEKIYRNKVQMFNEGGEIALFQRLNFNAIFYGEVIAGGKMPNLMYMTSFASMEDRNNHWKTFSADPEWKKISGMPEYQNNVSHIDITLTYPADYSDY